MQIGFRIVEVAKRFPLRISRGVSGTTQNLFVRLSDDAGNVGWGEAAPGTGYPANFAEIGQAELTAFCQRHPEWIELSIHALDALARAESIPLPALNALENARWDLLAQRAGLPLYQLLGLPRPTVPTSITLGIEPEDVVRERVPALLADGAKVLKIKLGSPEGRAHDRQIYAVAREVAAPFGVSLRVDANGGWTPEEAIAMDAWLAERDCGYVEQPLARGQESELPALFAARKLPLFLDESVQVAADVARWADRCDGVNLKLMKTGSLLEAWRAAATARSHGLKLMVGCMSESAVGIAAMAALSGLCDHVDLDSHMNHAPDPAEGLEWDAGVVLPPERPGHGARLREG